MKTSERRNSGARILLAAASLVVVIAGLRAAAPLLLPLLIAVFLSVLSSPLMGWLMRRLPKGVAVLLTVLANFAVLVAIGWLVSGSITAFVRSWPRYQTAIESKAITLITETSNRLAAFGFETPGPTDPAGSVGDPAIAGDSTATDPSSPIDPSSADPAVVPPAAIGARPPPPPLSLRPPAELITSALRGVLTTLRGLANLVSYTLIVLLLMIFLLFEAAALPEKLQRAFAWRDEDMTRLYKIRLEIQRYLGIKTLISLTTGAVITLWVSLLRLDYPLLWGLIAFLFNYIPTLGSILASIPAVILAWVDIGLGHALLVGFGYLVVNLVFGNFLEPHLMGRRFGLSTLVVFLSLVFWYWLWGPLGALLSVPLTMIIKIMLENTTDLRWIALLLGGNPTPTGTPTPTPAKPS